MNEPVAPSAAALRAANALAEQYSIGTASRFCDDAPDWDSASDADIAGIIDESTGLPDLLEVARGVAWNGVCSCQEGGDGFVCDYCRARAAIAKAEGR